MVRASLVRSALTAAACSAALGAASGDAGIAAVEERSCRNLVELCCDAGSELSRLAPEYGIEALRITETDRFDLARGVETARGFIGSRRDVDAWAALPCTSWCTWTYLNEARLGPSYVARLAWRRRRSLKMVGHAETCILDAVASGGGSHSEWLRRNRG